MYRATLNSGQPADFRPVVGLTPIALGIALSLATPGLAFAQSNETSKPANTSEKIILPTIDVSGEAESDYKPPEPNSPRFTQPLLDTAQTINVVPKEVIQARAATTLRDVLRNVSGISVQAGEGGTPAGDQLTVRGFSARTDIFIDNVRDFGGYTRDPFNLEQVEVVKGPSSDYSGRGSTGGSINLVSKAPFLETLNTASVTLGTDEYYRTALDSNFVLPGIENAAARLNLVYHDQDVAGRDVVDNQRYGIAPSLAFGIGTPTEVTFSLFHLAQDNTPDYGIPWVPPTNNALPEFRDKPAPVDFENFYGLKDRDFEKTKTTLATVEIEHEFAENVHVRNLTRWGLTDRDSLITAPRFLNDNSTTIRRSDEKERDEKDSIISNLTDLTVNFATGSLEHTFLVGIEGTIEDEKRYTQVVTGVDSPPTDLYNPNPDDPYLENYQRTGGTTEADGTSVGVFLSDSVDLNEHWQLNGGARYDYYNLEFRPDGLPLQERTDNEISYRGGIVYKPVEAGSIYVGYGTSFNPTAEALSIATGVNNLGIVDLDPEENRTIEFGTKWALFNEQMFLTAAVFRTEKTNGRTQDPNDPTDLLVLEGEQEVQGFELGLAGNITKEWKIYAGYTFLDSEVKESKNEAEIGNELPNTPDNSFNLWTTYDILADLQLGFGALFVDERFNNVNNLRTAPDYWTYDALVAYTVNKHLNVQFNVQNLTDHEYIDYVGGGHFIPGLGRTFLLTSSVNF